MKPTNQIRWMRKETKAPAIIPSTDASGFVDTQVITWKVEITLVLQQWWECEWCTKGDPNHESTGEWRDIPIEQDK